MLQLAAILVDGKIFNIAVTLLLDTAKHEMNVVLLGTNIEYAVIFSQTDPGSVRLRKEHFIPKSTVTAVKMCS